MKNPKRRKYGEESYWKTATDVITGILMIVILIMMLLLLYLTQAKHSDQKNPYKNSEYATQAPTHVERETEKNKEKAEEKKNNSGGGKGEDDPGIYNEKGKNEKAAVFVTVIDKETKAAIKEKGILFELYKGIKTRSELLTLYTYYPQKKGYNQYETTANGTFFLPEKIVLGSYFLRNLKAPEGYEIADDVKFKIKEPHDWPNPFKVYVPMSPIKNAVRIQTRDVDTGEAVAGGVYDVFAAEDITTLDGTLRYHKGKKVDKITCNKDGYGESKDLYLGKYEVRQNTAQQYYALSKKSVNAEVVNNRKQKTDAVKVMCEKTRVKVKITDEYNQEPIKNAVYSMDGRDDLVTGKDGTFTVSDLDKNKEYTLTLKSLPDKYKAKSDDIKFKVDLTGRVKGDVKAVIEKSAYTTRLSVSVSDMLLHREVENHSVSVYDSNDKLVASWTTTSQPHIEMGLAAGKYKVVVDGEKESAVKTNLVDNSNLQYVNTSIWTILDTIAVAAIALFVAGLIVLIVYLNRKRKGKKSNED